jgi:hypothetical protein
MTQKKTPKNLESRFGIRNASRIQNKWSQFFFYVAFFQKRKTVPKMRFLVENCVSARNGKVFGESL